MLTIQVNLALIAAVVVCAGCSADRTSTNQPPASAPQAAASQAPVVVNDTKRAQEGDPRGNYNMAQVWAWSQLSNGLQAYVTAHGAWPVSMEALDNWQIFEFPVATADLPVGIRSGTGVLVATDSGQATMSTARFHPDGTTTPISHELKLHKFQLPRLEQGVPTDLPRAVDQSVWGLPAGQIPFVLQETSPDQQHLLVIGLVDTWNKVLHGYWKLHQRLPQSAAELEAAFPLRLIDNPLIRVHVISQDQVTYELQPDDEESHRLHLTYQFGADPSGALSDCPGCPAGTFRIRLASAQLGGVPLPAHTGTLDP